MKRLFALGGLAIFAALPPTATIAGPIAERFVFTQTATNLPGYVHATAELEITESAYLSGMSISRGHNFDGPFSSFPNDDSQADLTGTGIISLDVTICVAAFGGGDWCYSVLYNDTFNSFTVYEDPFLPGEFNPFPGWFLNITSIPGGVPELDLNYFGVSDMVRFHAQEDDGLYPEDGLDSRGDYGTDAEGLFLVHCPEHLCTFAGTWQHAGAISEPMSLWLSFGLPVALLIWRRSPFLPT